MSNTFQYSLHCKFKNENGFFFGPGPATLLTYIQEGLSLHQAAGKMNMAYSKAWKIMNHAEKELGFPLIVRTRGGNKGGGSRLTQEGAIFLQSYLQFTEKLTQFGDVLFQQTFPPVPMLSNKEEKTIDIL